MTGERSALGAALTMIGLSAAWADQPDDEPVAYEFEATYTADLWHNAHGGLRTGTAYLDHLDLSIGVDGETAWGLPGLTAFVRVLNSNGERFSERYVGDAMTVSNIDASRAWRPYEAWLEWSRSATSSSWRVGLYDLNSEFDTNDTRMLFIHSSHGVGHDLGQTGHNGPSIFPVTALGTRVAWTPHDRWRALVAVMDAVPGDPDDPSRPSLHLSSEEGALAIGEVQRTSTRARKLTLGVWRYTRRSSDAGAYVSSEFAVGSDWTADSPATTAFVRYGVADGSVNEFDRTAAAGVRRRGQLRGFDYEMGFAASYARLGATARQAATDAGESRDSFEGGLELTCRIVVADWLVVQPDVQYVLNPGATRGRADSLIFGLRLAGSWQ